MNDRNFPIEKMPKGFVLYHGTSSEGNFDIPDGPAWFSEGVGVSKTFANWHDGPNPRVLTLETTKKLKLIIFESHEDINDFAEGVGDPKELADLVCEAGYDGWIVPRNYPDGDDIMICDPSSCLEKTGEEMLESLSTDKNVIQEHLKNNQVKNLAIFDFDGTLFATPDQKEYKELTGNEWRGKDWFSNPESLDDSVFDPKPIEWVMDDYNRKKEDPETYIVVMSGRLIDLRDLVKKWLDSYDVKSNELLLKKENDQIYEPTDDWKVRQILRILTRFPELEKIEIWEDDDKNIKAFKEMKKNLIDIELIIHKVDGDVEIDEAKKKRRKKRKRQAFPRTYPRTITYGGGIPFGVYGSFGYDSGGSSDGGGDSGGGDGGGG